MRRVKQSGEIAAAILFALPSVLQLILFAILFVVLEIVSEVGTVVINSIYKRYKHRAS